MFIALAFLTLAPAQNQLAEKPANLTSSMVSEAWAEISWDAVETAVAYKIEIRKTAADGKINLQLEEKTVWTEFYFRVADPKATWEFRVSAIGYDHHESWTNWTTLKTDAAISFKY